MIVGSQTGVVKQQSPETPKELPSSPKITPKRRTEKKRSFSIEDEFSTPSKRLKISSNSPAVTEKVFGKLSMFGTSILYQHFLKRETPNNEKSESSPASETEVFGSLPKFNEYSMCPLLMSPKNLEPEYC